MAMPSNTSNVDASEFADEIAGIAAPDRYSHKKLRPATQIIASMKCDCKNGCASNERCQCRKVGIQCLDACACSHAVEQTTKKNATRPCQNLQILGLLKKLFGEEYVAMPGKEGGVRPTECFGAKIRRSLKKSAKDIDTAELMWQVLDLGHGERLARGNVDPRIDPHDPEASSMSEKRYEAWLADDDVVQPPMERPELLAFKQRLFRAALSDSGDYYYSFCREYWTMDIWEDDWHCTICNACQDKLSWRCGTCNACGDSTIYEPCTACGGVSEVYHQSNIAPMGSGVRQPYLTDSDWEDGDDEDEQAQLPNIERPPIRVSPDRIGTVASATTPDMHENPPLIVDDQDEIEDEVVAHLAKRRRLC